MYSCSRWARICSGSGRRFFAAEGNGKSYSCKLLVLGGGSGGCSVAAKFVSKLGKNQVIVIDPADRHYYQPMLTLVGGGVKKVEDTWRPMESVLPKGAKWLKETVGGIDPARSRVTTEEGSVIDYDFLVVSLGLELHFEKIKGLNEALKAPESGVCSNYSPKFAPKTFETLKKLRSGNAVFTFPNTPIKCGGAPLKVMFISEHYLRNAGCRNNVSIYYKTALPVVFTAKYYAEKLLKICIEREIDVGLREELVEVRPGQREAVFASLDRPNDVKVIGYSMLHVTPPMYPPLVLQSDSTLHDHNGYLKVNKATLQHDTHSNIYGIGDCTNLPTSKTAAAVAAQSGVLYDNLLAQMKVGTAGKSKYDGYTSCPLITGFGSCIMAEFDYDLKPLETFPFDQSKEHFSMYLMKKDVMPQLYWHAMLKGYWRGPGLIRKVLHLGRGR